MMVPEPSWQMWATFALIVGAIILYATERFPLEQTSLALLAALLVLFHFAPLEIPEEGAIILLDARTLLAGFADPALVAVLALMVVGQGLIRTGALDEAIRIMTRRFQRSPALALTVTLVAIATLSAFINNTPIVVIFIPVMATIAERLNKGPSRLMMPLSFAAILGGMVTLIGSSTNLLVAGAVAGMEQPAIGFFDFAGPGVLLALIGMAYVIWILPRLLPERESMASQIAGEGKQFIAQIEVRPGSPLVGQSAVAGMIPHLKGMTVRLIQRGEESHLPPFEDVLLRAGDTVVVAATRAILTEALARTPELVEQTEGEAEEGTPGNSMLAEAMVTPASRVIGRNLRLVGFHYHTGCIILGVQRRSRMMRGRMEDIRLEAGDVLLVLGPRERVTDLRFSREVLLIEWSTMELPARHHAKRALGIFTGVVALAATGVVPIAIAALVGALGMVTLGCLNVRQAARAVDRQVAFLVAAALAMGSALQATGGASYLAQHMVGALSEMGPALVLSAMFALVAIMTNLLSNSATAVLFTPIAINTALALNVDPMVFIHAVIFAANCSFATPMGYQTNLLVMGPGHYKFSDYLRGGTPLIVLIWLAFSLFAPWYYGL
ncbi:MAG: SLC13 family permease [Rhodospirillaceae bacterium]|jgi:di/tricarboxylate transporter|nr:SLC13 family permease [Rhodospirillaceae bacterium]MBT5898849.1 SLC13 family permease [Rhodospirillaceae bacterium]MBT7760286.1 SLC13 family permease [Rhodospirillaceae bacterium]